MKRILFFPVILLAFVFSAWAQNDIVTTVTPKVRMFPSSGFSYLDDPGRYFNIQMINTTNEVKNIFFTIELSCDFSASGENFFINTKKDFQPTNPITIGTTPLLLNRSHFDQIIGNLNPNAYETNADRSTLVNRILTLPEGQYRFCITPYEWTGHNTPNPTQLGQQVCYTFTICYSGSAPEFTTPINGFSAGNLNNSNPANNLLSKGAAASTARTTGRPMGNNSTPTSDNRNSSQYAVLPLQRNLNFSWTGVISNCLSSSDFNYTLKIVEVYQNQNIQDAIDQNATIATINNKTKTSYQHDTLTNRHFRLQQGHVYAAQVQATLKNNMLSEVRLGNGGKSQVIAFVWGEGPLQQEMEGSITSSVTDNRDNVSKAIREPYLVTPGQDRNTINTSNSSQKSGNANVGSGNYVTSGTDHYYQLKKGSSLPVEWMPVRGDSVLNAGYMVSLYEYVGGDVANSMNVQPIASKTIFNTLPDANFDLNNTTLQSLTEDWSDILVEGYKYVINLKSEVDFSYNQKTTYTITEYIHNMPSYRDSVINTVKFATNNYESNVVFAWGIDSGTLDKVYPPQFSYPVDLSDKQWNDTTWTQLPDVTKRESFSFRWKSASGIDYGDQVTYKLSVAELPKGKKPQQVTKMLFEKEGITTTEYIDSVLFDSLKTGKQYLARVQVFVKQVGDTSSHYNFLNSGKSHYATFKLIDPPVFVADLNNKLKCSPNALDNLSKEIITPRADSLVSNKVRLKMGSFPLVMQTCRYDENKHTYSGDGYVIWHPFGVDARLKVKVDSIQINKNFEIVKGSAVSTATDSSTYLSALCNDLEMDQWTNDDINAVVSKLGENKNIKNFYNRLQRYGEKCAKKYGGLLGPLSGENTSTPVLTFPLSITDADITGSDNVIFAINNMYFSPVTALMNIWAIFAAQSDNAYVPFLANNICMDQQGFLSGSNTRIELYMGRDYEVTLNNGYKMRFKKSSTFSDPKDGTVIVVDKGKMDYMMAEIQFDMNSNDVMGIETDGTPRKGKVVHANLLTKIKNWDNWVAKITMDPFAVVGADRFTFVPTGKGIYYDHSATETPSVVTFPNGYFTSNGSKSSSGNNNKQWQGFYWDELTVFLSDEISNTFVDGTNKKDSMVTYSYGINGTVVDSSHYCYPGSRINFGAKGVIIDNNGFTAQLFARDLVRASTKDGGGWAFSLDTIDVKFLKNQYKNATIKGGFGIPLLSGDLRYNCSIGADSLAFSIKGVDKTLKLDLWAASVNLDNKSSRFKIKKVYKEDRTRIDLSLFGKINVNFKKIGIPINCSLAKFEHMGFRNYNSSSPKSGTASIDKFEFDIGAWSFASPQKTIGGAPSDGNGEQFAADKPLGSVSFGGFTFSLTKFNPIVSFVGKNLKLGFSVGGEMKFATEGTDLGAECGFSVWGIVDPSNRFHVEKVDAALNKIKFKDIDFDVFKLNGELEFFNSKSNPNPISTGNDNGFGGSLTVTFMSNVTLAMKVGFGTSTSGSNTYTWWYFDGACKFMGGIPLGAVSINGFSGGFAYNMRAKNSISSSQYSAVNLLKVADKNTNDTQPFGSGIEYVPAINNWVANAGISLVLTGAENTMNADGLVSLRIANKHFSGIFIDANAYVLTKMNTTATPGDGSNNSSPLVRAKAIIGFEKTNIYDYFRLSIAVKANINLSDLLKGASSNVFGSSLTGAHSGTSLSTNSNINSQLNNLNGKSDLSSHSSSEREAAANQSNSGGSTVGFNVSASIPIDFELKHYKKKDGTHKANSTDWYFAIGKPEYDKRVQLSAKLDLIICSAKSEFTFYMQTGNAFAYKMPPLSKELQSFFGISSGKKKLDTDKEDIKKNRKIANNDWLSIDKGGGFCMGSTFHASVSFNCLLYVDVTSDLGFDVALLDVGGVGCPGYSQIGKHNFYGLGRAYAALQGDVGLKINLGFWKGKFSLFSAGVGALLQGGGPNPSYAYGLLRFKVSMLNGLLKFSTSVDFKLGNVCVPGVGDPLANVKLFQNVTPGFDKETTATSSNNAQSPLQIGTIVSNMPWDTDVYLSDGSTSRRFWFTLLENSCTYSTKESSKGSYKSTAGVQKLQFTPNENDANVILFETQEGGFVDGCYNKLVLKAQAFERRQSLQSKINSSEYSFKNGNDFPYYISGDKKGQKMTYNTSSFDWFDPIFMNDKTNKTELRAFKKDTTLYFKTKELGTDLNNLVVYSWPYNGDKMFPYQEYAKESKKTFFGSKYEQPYAMLYLYKDVPKIFNKTTLSNNGKELKIFMLKFNGEAGDIEECSYTYYPTAKVPYVKVKLPKAEYSDRNVARGPHKLRFLLVNKNQYTSAQAAANAAMTAQTKETTQLSTSRYTQAQNAHKSNSNNKSSSSSGLNLKNQQLEEIYNSKTESGTDTMTYYRTKIKNDYKICSSIGDCVYEWTWFTDFDFATYQDWITTQLSESNLSNAFLKHTGIKIKSSYISIDNYNGYNCIRENPWMFMEYDPNDPKLYNTNCIQPPRAYYAIQPYGNGNNALQYAHTILFQRFLNMEKAFKQTPLLEYRYSNSSGDLDFHFGWGDADAATVKDASLKSELKKRLSGGFINTSSQFSGMNYRVKNNSYERCNSSNYHPTTIDKPTILKFYTPKEMEPMDDKYFSSNYTSLFTLGYDDLISPYWTIYDYATHATVDDVKKFHDFFQENQKHASNYNKKGWSSKATDFKNYYSSPYRYSYYSYEDFPFDMPEIYLVTHYMTALQNIYRALSKNVYYTTTLGTNLHFISKERYYVPTNLLQQKDAYWSQYWWSAEAQTTNYGSRGFDREFYYYSDKTQYFSVVSNSDGKSNYPTYKKSFMDKYFTENLFSESNKSFKNYIQIYYLSSWGVDFEQHLLDIAYDVRRGGNVDGNLVFHPNKTYNYKNVYYPVNVYGTSLYQKLIKCNNLEVQGSWK